MTTPFTFDYNQFYDYYNNKTNLSADKKPPITYYYLPHDKRLLANYRLKHYITIDNKRFYVTTTGDRVMFTFPQFIDGKYWDFHYHFGLDTQFIHDKIKTPAIFFHRTKQIPAEEKKRSDNCYFPDGVTIDKVEDIQCFQTRYNTMATEFPPDGEDFKYIEEIISRPFLGVRLGGAKRRTRRTRKHVRKHTHNHSRSAKL